MELSRIKKQHKNIKKIYQVDFEKMQTLLAKMKEKVEVIEQDVKRRQEEIDKYFEKKSFLDE